MECLMPYVFKKFTNWSTDFKRGNVPVPALLKYRVYVLRL